MFCSKCGRQINNDALFCTFCGSPTTLAAPVAPAAPAMPAAASIPAGVPTPGSIPMSSEGYAASVPLNAAGGAASVTVQGVEEYAADMPEEEYGADTVPAASMPMAEEIADENAENIGDISEPLEYEESTERSLGIEQPAASVPFPARESAVPELVTAGNAGTVIDFSMPIQTAPTTEDSEKPAKYYTFGHIALCLAAVGVMAIVAGIFAGLYFSVI